jgi:hypothetical protein
VNFRAAYARYRGASTPATKSSAYREAMFFWNLMGEGNRSNMRAEYDFLQRMASGDADAAREAADSRARVDTARRALEEARRRGGTSTLDHLPGAIGDEVTRRGQQLADAASSPWTKALLALGALVAAGYAYRSFRPRGGR